MLRRQVVSALARRMATPSIATGAQVARFASAAEQSRRHVIAALVVNQPGCLAEIANMFAARGYNIDSLVVGRTEVEELSRMTVVVNGTDQSVVNVSGQDGSSHWSVMLGSVADDAPCDALYR
jgi:predicted regulator of amino acid metabolism with ACT domain